VLRRPRAALSGVAYIAGVISRYLPGEFSGGFRGKYLKIHAGAREVDFFLFFLETAAGPCPWWRRSTLHHRRGRISSDLGEDGRGGWVVGGPGCFGDF